METTKIILIILAALVLVLSTFTVIRSNDYTNVRRTITGAACAMLAIGIIGILIFRLPDVINEDPVNIDRSAYTYYLDGNEVDPATIDIDLYAHSYDDKEKKVFLTHKSDDGLVDSAIGFGAGYILRGLAE